MALIMNKKAFIVKAMVEIFPQKDGWVFVRVPKKYTEMTKGIAERGLVAITARVGKTAWDTSLLPMGDGTLFIALNAKVRKAEDIKIEDTIAVHFRLRKR